MIKYQLTTTNKELEEIIVLQQKNLPVNISTSEITEQGFVSAQHTLALLTKMHDAHPHVIAKENGKVVGYALCMLQEFRNGIPLLTPMFNLSDKAINELNEPLNYMVMGQVCVDKEYRKQGVFRALYNYMKENISKEYNAIITEVDVKNLPSVNAHKAIGFEVLKEHQSNNQTWQLIVLRT
ncbi:MAG: GNAT family N-acetyltransferase [Flavobacteriaceae bacterium]|nr:GNAT family N-acetyltransferase [Flavobacteriaceae bacterium]